MSLTSSIQAWLGEVDGRGSSAAVARRHIAAETQADVDAICATISPDVFFALPVRTRAGQELRSGTVLTDPETVRGYYAGRSGSYVVRESVQVQSLTTDWYVFNESSATLLGTGQVGSVDATGAEWVVRSAVLFPTAVDGIRGEICATRDPMDDVIRGTVAGTPGDALANTRLLDRLALAARDGDWVAAQEELAGNHSMAVRVDGVVHAELPPLFDQTEDLTLLTRVATDWYVFAEYLLRLASGGTRRLALLQPIEHGKVSGTYGYGRED